MSPTKLSAGKEMPKYQCIKKVHAFEIAEILEGTDGATINPAEEGYSPIFVDGEYMKKHNPQVGGYYVVYEDGYKLFSPKEPFEKGYVKIGTKNSE